jgi:hypothetical protein
MLLISLLSLFVTAVATIIGISLRLSEKKVEKSKDPNTSDDPKMKDELPDFWQRFMGLVDDTPNYIRAIVAGPSGKGQILHYISYQEWWDPDNKKWVALKPGDLYPGEGPVAHAIRLKWGKRYIGFPLFRSLRPLSIERVVPISTLEKSLKLKEQLRSNTVRRQGLYKDILRPTLHENLTTQDNVRITVISDAYLEVSDPEPAFRTFPDSLLQNVDKINGNFISAKVTQLCYEDYKKSGKKGHKFEENDILEVNDLIRPLGLKITQLTMSNPELASSIQDKFDKRAEADVEAQTTIKNAKAKAEARREEGKGEADYVKNVGNAEAEIIERKAKADQVRIKLLTEFFIEKGVPGPEAAEMARQADLFEGQNDAIGKNTGVWAPGNNNIQIAVPGRKP